MVPQAGRLRNSQHLTLTVLETEAPHQTRKDLLSTKGQCSGSPLVHILLHCHMSEGADELLGVLFLYLILAQRPRSDRKVLFTRVPFREASLS